MLLHLAGIGLPDKWSALPSFQRHAESSTSTRHSLVDDPQAADALLYLDCHQLAGDWRLDTVARSPLAKIFPEKVFVLDQRDRPWCRFPGLYVSMPSQSFNGRFQRAWSYPFSEPTPALDQSRADPDLLFSFVGSPTHPCREPLFALRHAEAVVSRTENFVFHVETSEAFASKRQRFNETVTRSKFVLCPRGHGTASIRLFEVMAAGRVPVIISDEWVPPEGPNWESFSLRWPEGTTEGLCDELERREHEADRLGAAAAAAYAEWFSPSVAFERVCDLLSELQEARPHFPAHGIRDRRFFELAASRSARQGGAYVRAQWQRWRSSTISDRAEPG